MSKIEPRVQPFEKTSRIYYLVVSPLICVIIFNLQIIKAVDRLSFFSLKVSAKHAVIGPT